MNRMSRSPDGSVRKRLMKKRSAGMLGASLPAEFHMSTRSFSWTRVGCVSGSPGTDSPVVSYGAAFARSMSTWQP